jgi:hypothetical protein
MFPVDRVHFWLNDASLSWARKKSVVLAKNALNNKHVMRSLEETVSLSNLIVLLLPPRLKLEALKNSFVDQISGLSMRICSEQ